MRIEPDEACGCARRREVCPSAKSETLQLAAGERKSGVVLHDSQRHRRQRTGRRTRNGDPLSGVAVTATETPQAVRAA